MDNHKTNIKLIRNLLINTNLVSTIESLNQHSNNKIRTNLQVEHKTIKIPNQDKQQGRYVL